MIEIRTLGRTSVAVRGAPLTGEAAWPKSLALIVYMAREPGPDRRDEILGVLWPDREEKRARRALNQLLYTLRKTSPELDLESVEDALDFGREVWLDVEEFERRLEGGDLKSAVELYEGPFLADLALNEPEFDHWADRQRAMLQRRFRKAALELATEARAAGDYEGAVRYCQRLLSSDPLDDEVQHLLIECLYLRGDRVAALRQFDIYRDLLARELEVEPLEHTLALVERIREEPLAEGAAGAEVAEEPAGVAAEATAAEESAGGAAEAGSKAKIGELPAIVWLRQRRGPVALAAALVVVILLAIWLWPRAGEEEPVVATGAVVASEAVRVAVLPFEPHGADAAGEGLAAGVAQLLSLNLDGFGPIQSVDYRLVLRRWQGSDLSRATVPEPGQLSSLARELGATSLVLGDLHASGDELRVVAELVGAETGELLSRADLRGARDDLFALLDELTLSLVEGVWTAPDLPALRATGRETRSLVALKHYVRAQTHAAEGEWGEAVSGYRAAVREDSAFLPAARSLAELLLQAAGDPADEARAAVNDMLEPNRRWARRIRVAGLMAVLEFASGRPISGYGWLDEAERVGLPAEHVQAWRALVAVYGLGDEPMHLLPVAERAPADREEFRSWVRDAWLNGAVAVRSGVEAAARAAAEALAGASDSTATGRLAASLAAGLEAELALAANDSAAAREGLRGAVQVHSEVGAEWEWGTLSYFRYRLAELLAPGGNSAAAAAMLRAVETRSLGSLLLVARAQLALGAALESIGETGQAAVAYLAAARWRSQVEPAFAEEVERARAGVTRTQPQE